MKLNGFWKHNKKLIISTLIILFSGSAGTIAIGPEDVVAAFRMLLNANEINENIHQSAHDKEMLWEFAAIISDNWDGDTIYEAADDNGRVYIIDVRWVNGPNNSGQQIPLAFVDKPMYRIYPILTTYKYGPEGRWYINLHDNKSGESQNCYLHKKQ